MVLVKSKAKEAAKRHSLRFPDRAVSALEKTVLELIDDAARRAAANKRKTIIPADF